MYDARGSQFSYVHNKYVVIVSPNLSLSFGFWCSFFDIVFTTSPTTMLIIRVMPLIWVWTCYLPVLSAALSCQTRSKPNPIVQQYPKEVTGTINGTTAIIPIPYDLARSIVPSQYGILTRAYQALIPNFPSDMYPAEFEGVLDHDVQMSGIKIPDFQVRTQERYEIRACS